MKTLLSDKASETAIYFIEKFDKFFDILNVSNYSSYKCLKAFKAPYRWADDKRLATSKIMLLFISNCDYTQWLRDFLAWLSEWETQVNAKKVHSSEKKKLMLSTETLLGIRITSK